MIDQLKMHNQHECPSENGLDKVTTLTSVAPHLELVAMTSGQVQVFLLVETQLLFPIIPAMVVIEE